MFKFSFQPEELNESFSNESKWKILSKKISSHLPTLTCIPILASAQEHACSTHATIWIINTFAFVQPSSMLYILTLLWTPSLTYYSISTGPNSANNEEIVPPADMPCAPYEEIFPSTEHVFKVPGSIAPKHGLMIFAGGQEIIHLKSDVLIKGNGLLSDIPDILFAMSHQSFI